MTEVAPLQAYGRKVRQLESWGDDAATLRGYQAVGFSPELQETSYRRDVNLGAGS